MILSILDIKEQGIKYIIATLFCILFAMIYEFFSHNVYSNFMIFAFVIPLLFGVIVSFAIYFTKTKNLPSNIEFSLYNASIATFTIGSIIQGVLEIYGTTNGKVYLYLIVGIILLVASISLYFIRIFRHT